jgi:hypothetical protein
MFLTTGFHFSLFVTAQNVVLWQAATDALWGADCSKFMKAVSIHDFDRHFQIMRTTAFRMDGFLSAQIDWLVAETTGNIRDCIDINDRKIRAIESYIRAAPPPPMKYRIS